ncbi:hypothetical protein Tco_1085316 [Tanacetum coccineum]
MEVSYSYNTSLFKPKEDAWEQFSSNIAVASLDTSPTTLHDSIQLPSLTMKAVLVHEGSLGIFSDRSLVGTEYHPPHPRLSSPCCSISHGSEEGSLKLQELMGLITTLSDRIGVLEADLSKTKKIYSSAYTKLTLRVKKLESQIKVGKARRHSRFVLSDTEVGGDDSSKQGRVVLMKVFKIDNGVS